MILSEGIAGQEAQIIALFEATFAASEGASEGAVIGDLVRALLSKTPSEDIYVFTAHDTRHDTAHDKGTLIGGAIFSRLVYAEDPRSVFILSPMAVASHRQGQGVGQALLRHALTKLRDAGVDVAITYGDPAFYGKIGFEPLDPERVAAPLPLSMPIGWIGQSLTETPLVALTGACSCVEALNDPSIW
jgi:predicted N-acetyltransferase YhbS